MFCHKSGAFSLSFPTFQNWVFTLGLTYTISPFYGLPPFFLGIEICLCTNVVRKWAQPLGTQVLVFEVGSRPLFSMSSWSLRASNSTMRSNKVEIFDKEREHLVPLHSWNGGFLLCRKFRDKSMAHGKALWLSFLKMNCHCMVWSENWGVGGLTWTSKCRLIILLDNHELHAETWFIKVAQNVRGIE